MFYKEIIARGVSYDRVMASESVRADEGLTGCEERGEMGGRTEGRRGGKYSVNT